MNVEFDTSQILAAEFGVGQRLGEMIEYSLLPADETVQGSLVKEAESAIGDIAEVSVYPQHFDPSEKYGGKEYLVLPLRHELSSTLAELHDANSLPLNSPEMQRLKNAFCYFLRGTDTHGRRLTALNRAAQFKATLGRQGRLMALLSDGLRVIPDPVMQLNTGFDIVIDSEFIHILHPASFRFLASVGQAVAQAVPRNIRAIAQAVPYVDWSNIEEYAVVHSRAASLLSSIRTQGYANNLDKAELQALCEKTGVLLSTSGSQIGVPVGQILPFLEVVDRRRYEIGLVPDTPEQYRASSRVRVRGSGR